MNNSDKRTDVVESQISLINFLGKSKGGKGSSSKSHAHHVDYLDVINVIDIESYWIKLEEVINNQRHFFVQHINIR